MTEKMDLIRRVALAEAQIEDMTARMKRLVALRRAALRELKKMPVFVSEEDIEAEKARYRGLI